MFSDRHINAVNVFNILFHWAMMIYNTIAEQYIWLIYWIPMSIFTLVFGIYGIRKRAMDRARKK